MHTQISINNHNYQSFMKQFKTIFIGLVLLVCASCANDLPEVDDNIIRIQANVGMAATKAASNVQGTQFEDDEKVNIYLFEHLDASSSAVYNYGSAGLVAHSADGAGGLTPDGGALYFPANGHGIDVYGIYPSTVTESTTSFTVQADQTLDANYKASDLMYAPCQSDKKKGNTVQLPFAHQLSKVIVKLVQGNGLNTNDLDGATVQILNTYTKCSIGSLSKAGIGAIAPSSNGADKKSITVGTWPSSSSEGIAAIVIPQTVQVGTPLFQVSLTNGANYVYTIPSTGAAVTFLSGNVYTYTLTVKTAAIDVTSTITNWNPGRDESGDAILQ